MVTNRCSAATTRKELAGTSKRLEIARALFLVSHIAAQDMSITGSDVALRLNVDRSVISQAVQRVSRYPDLIASTKTILSLLELETSQH
jgi:predicted regulator of amino acid metabolism with ACT domain